MEDRNAELLYSIARNDERNKSATAELASALHRVDMWKEQCAERIAIKNISTQDKVLFIRDRSGRYVAYNHGSPHRYLGRESLGAVTEHKHQSSDKTESTAFVLGKVIEIKKYKAEESQNFFNLPLGVDFYELNAEIVSYDTLESLSPKKEATKSPPHTTP
jgi:hypothetical protein